MILIHYISPPTISIPTGKKQIHLQLWHSETESLSLEGMLNFGVTKMNSHQFSKWENLKCTIICQVLD